MPDHSINRRIKDNTSLKRISGQSLRSAVLYLLTIPCPLFAIASERPGTATIDNDQAETIYLNGGATLFVAPTGTITASPGIYAVDDLNTIQHSGATNFAGDSGIGIFVNGTSNTITNAGSIGTTALSGFGILVNGASNTITNAGWIDTTAVSGFGILANGASHAITNAGSIGTTAVSGFGIFANGTSHAITNAGSINTSAARGFGILTNGSNHSIINTGSISTSGDIGFSILAAGSNNIITNSGSISTTGTLGVGIHSDKGRNTITNSGSIHSSGVYGIGILTNGSNNTIANSGSISTSGDYAIGIYSSGRSNTITNSGRILSRSGYAIFLDGIDNTLNIHDAFFDGIINIGSEGTVNIATSAESSMLLTFEGDARTINGSGPVPVFINLSTQQAATYDPTVFASSSDALADMTNAISSLAPRRFNATDNDHPIWAKGFEMASSYEGSHSTQERAYSLSGIAIGYDAKSSKELTIGVLGGYGKTSLTAEGKTIRSFRTTSDDGFTGIYGQKRWRSYAVDFAILGGLQSFRQQRFINNNLALDGTSNANASYQGWWISTEAGVIFNAGTIYGWSLQPMAHLRYAQQWMGSYAETGGGSANANVNGHSVAIGQSFVGIGASKTIKTNMGKDTKLILDGQIGYMYRGATGDDTLEVTIIGQSLSLPTEFSGRNAVAVSAGITIDLSSAVALKIRGDFASGDGMRYSGGGWAGLSVQF
jgi:uncharacterized protein with beta-barrel porin domain